MTAYGEVMPCPFIQVGFGNLLEDDVETIRNRALRYVYFQEYVPRCLAAQDLEFIKNVKCYSADEQGLELPVPEAEAFYDRQAALGLAHARNKS